LTRETPTLLRSFPTSSPTSVSLQISALSARNSNGRSERKLKDSSERVRFTSLLFRPRLGLGFIFALRVASNSCASAWKPLIIAFCSRIGIMSAARSSTFMVFTRVRPRLSRCGSRTLLLLAPFDVGWGRWQNPQEFPLTQLPCAKKMQGRVQSSGCPSIPATASQGADCRDDLSPGGDRVSPGGAWMSPGRGALSPGAGRLSPGGGLMMSW